MKTKELLIYSNFVLIILLQNLFYFGFNQIIIFTIIALSFIFLEKDKRIYFFIFIIPFRSSFPFNLINIFFLILLLFTFKFKYSRLYILVLIISLIELFTSIESDNLLNSIRFLTVLITTFIIANIPSIKVKPSSKKIGFYYVLGFTVSGILYIISYSNFFNIELLLNGQLRLGSISPQLLDMHPNYIYFLNYNANEIGINAIFSILFLIYNSKRSFSFLFLIIFSLFLGTMTYSRTFFLSLFILFFYIFFRFLKVKTLSNKLVILSFVSLSIFTFIHLISFDILDFINGRFLNSFDDPRVEISLGYLRVFDFESLLFGKGAINYYYFYNQEYSLHNGFLEIFFSYGLFGILLFISFFFYLFRKSNGNNFTNSCLLIFLLTIMFHQLLGSTQLIFILGILFIIIKNNNYIYNFKERLVF